MPELQIITSNNGKIKEFKELVKSDKWDVIVVDDITKEEFDKIMEPYTG